MEFDIFAASAVSILIASALVVDLRTRRIPNGLTVAAFALGVIYHIATGGWSGFLMSAGGFATGFGTLLILWLMGGGGGGDVKLMGAVGAWMGPLATLLIFIGSAVFAIFCTIAVVLWSHFSASKLAISQSGADSSTASTSVLKQTIPYALPVALSCWTVLVVQWIYG